MEWTSIGEANSDVIVPWFLQNIHGLLLLFDIEWSIADEVVREEEKQIERRKRKKVTQLKIGSNCSKDFVMNAPYNNNNTYNNN